MPSTSTGWVERAGPPIFGDDHVKRYWCAVDVTECRRFAVLYKWDFVHANAVYLLRLADEELMPVTPDMQSVNRVQVVGDKLLVHTDLDAPHGRLCVAPLTAPTEWRTLIPESSETLQTVTGVGGRLYAVYSQAASHHVRIHAEDGTYLRELTLPALGSVNHTSGGGVISGVRGAWGEDDVWVGTSRRTCSRRRSIGTTTKPVPRTRRRARHTVRADRRYPVMMFVPALNDRVAPPHDPLKMVARLQAEATQGGPYLLLPLRNSGHGGGATLTALIEQDVDELSFYCWALDVAPPSAGDASAPARR